MPRHAPRSDDPFAQMTILIARSARQGRGRLSPLSKWLVARHDAFASMLSEYPASWTAIADALAAIGVTDGKGNAPTAERVRKTWWDARQRVSAKRAQTSAVHSQPGPDEITHGVLSVQEVERAPRPRPRLKIRPALPRDPVASPTTSPSDARPVHAPPPRTSPAREPDVEVQRILHAMDKHKPGIPKLMREED